MTRCSICLGEIPDLDESVQTCQHCGAVAIAVTIPVDKGPPLPFADDLDDAA